MKLLLLVVLTISSAYGEQGRYRAEPREQDGPYQPSGWRPAGPRLVLPLRQELTPPDSYLPAESYGPPSKEYGPPQVPTTEAQQESTTTEIPTTTTTEAVQESEQIKDVKQKDEKLEEEKSKVSQQGIYYIYHPSGLLQKVIYMTEENAKQMAYSARLKYENVEPIRQPIYTYDPESFVLRQLQQA